MNNSSIIYKRCNTQLEDQHVLSQQDEINI